ncbi:MAG: T9SS type A sorting domain-containing protein [Bacteroidetes bacterium]|nr:T9SS type A sorting domain-containing protein [Bacteroidota bacterium]
MKKSLFILASLFCLKGFSQSSILISNMTNTNNVVAMAPNQIIEATTVAGNTATYDFDIKNTSSSTKSYVLKRYDIVLHASTTTTNVAKAHFCFAQNCYLADTYTAGPTSIPGGNSTTDLQGPNQYITTDLDEVSTVGYSLVKYTVYNTATLSDSVQFSIKYNGPLGISELSSNVLSALELFPNPATDATVLKVTSQKAMDAKVSIYNALGAVVSERTITIAEGKNKVDLSVSELSPGIYFAQIKMANSSVTKKLIIK